METAATRWCVSDNGGDEGGFKKIAWRLRTHSSDVVGEVKTGKKLLGNGDDDGALVTKAKNWLEGQEDLRRGG